MNTEKLNGILNGVRRLNVCVVGDICLDAYWHADMTKSRLSRETPHHPLPVFEERYSLGGGGNVLANLKALGVGTVSAVSIIGDDWRGNIIRRLLLELGIDTGAMLTDGTRVTPCYCKPMRHGISDVVYEDPRLDFENHQTLSARTEDRLLLSLKEAAAKADIIAVCDQMEYGVVTPRVRERICEIGRTVPVVVDSRDRIALYTDVIVKPNEVEAAAAAGEESCNFESCAGILSGKTGAPAIVTLGGGGSVWCENGKTVRVPAVSVEPPVDTVGAGDTFLSAFCAAYASGASGPDALAFANLASSVTIGKIGTTGTASPEELLAANGRQ